MVQQTFTDMEYANRNRTTKREAFLDAMESIIPWKEWMELIAPFYVQKERGRKLSLQIKSQAPRRKKHAKL